MGPQEWGRVDQDGTVWVRLPDGERAVGSYPGASAEDALAYFARKFEDLQGQVDLLEQRIAAGQVHGPAARASIDRLGRAVREANAVGDLPALASRLAALTPVVAQRLEQADQARQAARAQAQAARAALVERAEALAAVEAERLPWKSTGEQLRELFEQWRQLQRDQRLDKATEDELWRRFSAARTQFDRKRRQHFGALDDKRAEARGAKEAIVAEAEALAASTARSTPDEQGEPGAGQGTHWVAGAATLRDLMARWKATGRASRKDDDQLWARFRAAQDAFYSARSAALNSADAELRANLSVKEGLLREAEGLLPVTDAAAARTALRGVQQRWDHAGKVPRGDLARIDARLRAVEQAVRDAEQKRWTRNNPQARARAQDAVEQLETTINSLQAKLAGARDAGDAKGAEETEQALRARQEWLEQARRALADYGG